MKSKLKKIIIISFIGLFLVLLLNNTLIFNKGAQTEFNIPKQSAVYTESFIYVDGNWIETASTYDWCYGDGSWSTPYIIENVSIDVGGSITGSGIFINNSKNDYFIIRNCNVTKAGWGTYDAGIKLENTNHGTLINNNCYYNGGSGIYLLYSDNNTISGNTANGNDYDGIRLATECDNNTISGNTANGNMYAGIRLDNCDNTTISDNTANDNNYFGIYLYQSHYTNITGNTANSNYNGFFYGYGIYLENNCDNNTLSGNTANYNDGHGICLEYSDNNTISGNTANYNDVSGICFEYGCDDNIIANNIVNNNMENGIYLNDHDHFNTIANNTVNDNTGSGININDGSNDNIIVNNTVNDNTGNGIDIHTYCYRNNITGNTVNDNTGYGIRLYYYLCDNIIANNTVNSNGLDGIRIYSHQSNDNIIVNNIVNDNTRYGIYLESTTNDNTIANNTINRNEIGMYIYGSHRNTILGNYVFNNTNEGIYLESNCNNNTIIDNIFYSNTQGIRIASGCDNNSIYKNFLLENGIHAIDDGTDNTWNSTSIGNYWDNHTGPDVSPNDGIVDNPYSYIGGSAGSIDYLPIAEDGPPSIVINSPLEDDVFGTSAPSFSVTITDTFLDEMWYTLDGGLHNYTFTGSTGTIDQSAWDAMPDGMITLTFYASDIPGNIGSAEVNIEKDSHAPLIVISSPLMDVTFGANAPSFIVEISDDNLDSMWYSLDGGITNFFFTANGTINQAAWSVLSEGSVTITFYANDTLGNLESESVDVVKSLPPPEDNFIVIIIIVISIVAGVAIVTVVLLLRRRKAGVEI